MAEKGGLRRVGLCEEVGFEFGQELTAGDGKRRVRGWNLTRRWGDLEDGGREGGFPKASE